MNKFNPGLLKPGKQRADKETKEKEATEKGKLPRKGKTQSHRPKAPGAKVAGLPKWTPGREISSDGIILGHFFGELGEPQAVKNFAEGGEG